MENQQKSTLKYEGHWPFDLASDDFNALLQNRIFTTVPRAIVAFEK